MRGIWHRMALAAAMIAAFGLTTGASAQASGRYRHYLEGTLAGVAPGPVSGGLLLMGGGDRNFDAMRWFFAKAGHGHIVILRATQEGQIGEEFYREVGGILSAETFVTLDRAAAYDPRLLAALRQADGIFLSGGDQAHYVRRWRGTPVAELLDAHVAAGKPLGGTSAGLAMLGEKLYGCMDGKSLRSSDALAKPFGHANSIVTDFLHLPLLRGAITDTHFKERDRLGRLFAFVAKAQADIPAGSPSMIGLGVDESAALAVEADGMARIYATAPDGGAWLVRGAGLRGAARSGPLESPAIAVTGIGHSSVLKLPEGKVIDPSFERIYAVGGGKLTQTGG